jgi:hypothetical protein
MSDSHAVLLAELDRLAPADEVDEPNWADVVGRAEIRRRVRALPLALVAVVAVTIPAVALSSGVRSLLGLTGPTPVLRSAVPLVTGPIGNGWFAHLWRAPSATGGTCLFSSYDHRPTESGPPADWRGGGECTTTKHQLWIPRTSFPLVISLSIERRGLKKKKAWIPPVVSGIVDPSLHASRVAVTWRGGSRELALRKNWFVGGTPTLYIPPFRKFPFVVIAYDRSGHEVARRTLDSPSLMLLSGGWKEFARKYHAWQRPKKP